MLATKPVDFRKGAEGLAALVREHMGADPFSGTVYVFRCKRADRIKLLFWDGSGVCLYAKRREGGIFQWPAIRDGILRLSSAQLSALLEGARLAGACTPHRTCTRLPAPAKMRRSSVAEGWQNKGKRDSLRSWK